MLAVNDSKGGQRRPISGYSTGNPGPGNLFVRYFFTRGAEGRFHVGLAPSSPTASHL